MKNDKSLAVAYSVKSKAKKMASGGMVSSMNDVHEHYDSIAEAILAKKRKILNPTDEIDPGEQDVERPSVLEDMNLEANAKPALDIVGSIRKKMKSKR